MGRSFYYDKDANLVTSSNNFSTKITATPTAYGLVAAQASAYAALNTAWANAYREAAEPATRTSAKIAAKNDARTNLRANAAMLAAIIEATPTVTDEQKLDLGLPLHRRIHRLDRLDPPAHHGGNPLRLHHLPGREVRTAGGSRGGRAHP